MVFEVKGIEKRYNNKTILHNISFEIPESNITVILGKNGAGKTTLIKLMLGMISADKGDILFKGEKLLDIGHSYYQNVSAVLESVDNVYPFLTGKQNIEYFLGLSKQSINYMNDSIQALIDELTLLLVKHNLMSHLIKIEKLSPTVEETLGYFYSQRGGSHHEVI